MPGKGQTTKYKVERRITHASTVYQQCFSLRVTFPSVLTLTPWQWPIPPCRRQEVAGPRTEASRWERLCISWISEALSGSRMLDLIGCFQMGSMEVKPQATSTSRRILVYKGDAQSFFFFFNWFPKTLNSALEIFQEISVRKLWVLVYCSKPFGVPLLWRTFQRARMKPPIGALSGRRQELLYPQEGLCLSSLSWGIL